MNFVKILRSLRAFLIMWLESRVGVDGSLLISIGNKGISIAAFKARITQ